jgi:hypothetical protein
VDGEADFGVAGRSAAREHRRRVAQRRATIRAAHPRLGGLILALTGEPQSVRAWGEGARGERAVAAALAAVAGRGVVVLHDRRVPGTRSNIDHVAVGPSGVFVVDAKRRRARVVVRREGPPWRRRSRLYAGGRDEDGAVAAMAHQVAVVTRALAGEPAATGVAVMPVLCIVGATWGWPVHPCAVEGVWVGWPAVVARRVARPGPLRPQQVARIARALAVRLPPA